MLDGHIGIALLRWRLFVTKSLPYDGVAVPSLGLMNLELEQFDARIDALRRRCDKFDVPVDFDFAVDGHNQVWLSTGSGLLV
jgi:hypothetical protein